MALLILVHKGFELSLFLVTQTRFSSSTVQKMTGDCFVRLNLNSISQLPSPLSFIRYRIVKMFALMQCFAEPNCIECSISRTAFSRTEYNKFYESHISRAMEQDGEYIIDIHLMRWTRWNLKVYSNHFHFKSYKVSDLFFNFILRLVPSMYPQFSE